MTHTQGPWIIENKDILGAPNAIAHVCTVNHQLPSNEIKANTHLIAAAPEMLEALETLTTTANVKEIDPLIMFVSIEKAINAISKARGEMK